MSKYNHFARDLDDAFKAARSEYTTAYNAVEQAQNAVQNAGTDALKKQIAALQLQDAEESMRKESARIWSEFDAKAAELRRALEKEVQTNNLADPSAIDSNAVELMKTGVLTTDDYFNFADKYDGNATMLRLIGYYAREAAAATEDRKDKVALTVLAQDCANGMGKTLKAFDELLTAANYCSGRGGYGKRRNSPGFTVSMSAKWKELVADAVRNF